MSKAISIEQIIRQATNELKVSFSKYSLRISAWEVFKTEMKSSLEEIKNYAKAFNYFEYLYVDDGSTKEGLNYISLRTGQHPVTFPKNRENKMAVEGNGCLMFSQAADGHVICILYPYESDVKKSKIDYIIYGIYNNTSDIFNKLPYIIEFFFLYLLKSSVYGSSDLKTNIKFHLNLLIHSQKIKNAFLNFFYEDVFKNLTNAIEKILPIFK